MTKSDSNQVDQSDQEANTKGDFESSLNVLEGLVERLESEQLGLDDSLKLYEQGMGLAKHCQSLLNSAQQKVDLFAPNADGPEDFDPGDEFV